MCDGSVDHVATHVLRARARAALELVSDPCVQHLKAAGTSSDLPDASLRAAYVACLRHCWALVHDAYGVAPGTQFFAVHRPADPRNCLALCATAADARGVAAWWPGAPVVVTAVSSVEQVPEAWISMGVALNWRAPAAGTAAAAWLKKNPVGVY